MGNARVVITVGGWFDSLPLATRDFVMRKINHGVNRYGWVKLPADQRGSHVPGFADL